MNKILNYFLLTLFFLTFNNIFAKDIPILVISPGFSSDCVETLEEIDIQGRESFMENGGENFDLIPCLNDNPDHIDLIEKLVKKYI